MCDVELSNLFRNNNSVISILNFRSILLYKEVTTKTKVTQVLGVQKNKVEISRHARGETVDALLRGV